MLLFFLLCGQAQTAFIYEYESYLYIVFYLTCILTHQTPTSKVWYLDYFIQYDLLETFAV